MRELKAWPRWAKALVLPLAIVVLFPIVLLCGLIGVLIEGPGHRMR